MADLHLKVPFTLLIASPSKSGKSTLISKLLSQSATYFSQPTSNIYYFYNVWSPTFDTLKEDNVVTAFIQGVCTKEWIEEKLMAAPNITSVLDDQALHLTKDVAEFFSVGSHQFGVNFIFLAQNLFTKNPYSRDASLNATYIILGKNPKDQSSVRFLAQQMLPGRSKELVEAYTLATKEPYSHLLLDFNQDTPDHLRLRSNILSEREPMSVYIKR
jgi:hypothetical protein